MSQACRLTQMMQKKGLIVSYELILPFVHLSAKACADLAVNDVLLLALESLELELLKEEVLCAKATLLSKDKSFELEILELKEKPIEPSDSKKYEALKLSFGFVQCKQLEEKIKLPLGEINFEMVSLILKNIKIAEASLVLVDEKIALNITKVEK